MEALAFDLLPEIDDRFVGGDGTGKVPTVGQLDRAILEHERALDGLCLAMIVAGDQRRHRNLLPKIIAHAEGASV